MRSMHKKGTDMWMLVVFAGVAVILGFIVVMIIKGGLSTGEKNAQNLASCTGYGGECKEKCDDAGESTFSGYGCPEKVDGKIVDAKKDKCCISRNFG